MSDPVVYFEAHIARLRDKVGVMTVFGVDGNAIAIAAAILALADVIDSATDQLGDLEHLLVEIRDALEEED